MVLVQCEFGSKWHNIMGFLVNKEERTSTTPMGWPVGQDLGFALGGLWFETSQVLSTPLELVPYGALLRL